MRREITEKKINRKTSGIINNQGKDGHLGTFDKSISEAWREMIYFFSRDYSTFDQEQ